MAVWHPSSRVVLGSGGKTPRVAVLNADADRWEPVVELPPGHSVYSVALTPAGSNSVVAATKAGRLFWLDVTQNSESSDGNECREFVQGAPVLAVCCLSPTACAASDVAGRCFIWHRDGGDEPMSLDTGGHVVCSLASPDQQTLAGLSTSGDLLYWQLPEGALSRTVSGPPPPRPFALANLVYWQQAQALAYPAADGLIAVHAFGARTVQGIAAHRGGFFALMIVDGTLLTAGWQDERVKRWCPDELRPVLDRRGPRRVLACAACCASDPQLFLLRESGDVCVFSVDGSQMELGRLVTGGSFRVIAGPSWDDIESHLAARRSEEAHALALQLEDDLGRLSSRDAEPQHARLIELGYKHVSLGLRAQQARAQGDLVAELRAYRQLAEVLPRDEVGIATSLRRYAAVLAQVWRLREAQVVLDWLTELGVDTAEERQRLAPYLEALEAGGVVVVAEASPTLILDAAALLNEPVIGLLQVGDLKPVMCRGATLTADDIVSKYDQLRQADGREPLTAAVDRKGYWLSRSGVEQAELVTFAAPSLLAADGVQAGLRVINADLQTVVVPVVLFDPACATRGAGSLPNFEEIAGSLSANGWLRELASVLNQALRRLVTKARSDRKCSVGASHAG